MESSTDEDKNIPNGKREHFAQDPTQQLSSLAAISQAPSISDNASWIPAESTLFNKNTPKQLVHNQPSPSAAKMPPQVLTPPHYKGTSINFNSLLFTLPLILVFIGLATFSTLIYLQESDKNELQIQADEHNAKLGEKNIILGKLESITEDIKLIRKYQTGNNTETVNSLKAESNLLETQLSTYSLLSENPSFLNNINHAENAIDQYKKYTLYTSIGLFIPYLIALTHFRRSCLLVFKKYSATLTIIHSIPLMHYIMYIIISGLWNIESVQRKNSVFHTLPLSLCALITTSIALYHFSIDSSHWPTVAAISVLLWGITHTRQIQMLEYHKRQSNAP